MIDKSREPKKKESLTIERENIVSRTKRNRASSQNDRNEWKKGGEDGRLSVKARLFIQRPN